ncbi:uncharacterized protein N7484_006211 [Penicillium longicatenatum]|uniref:uncharacterized protein n=1 Tax=Penicillium longicatenatum TaxID=1561947 RepID=UPI002548CEC5|nr:uncharacterized protein N7484_006211 [Penicillium longicatenatum]KAJ5643704.1 hypothetical protein N7484_006211 [Penicillium longicatenatum]
MNAWAVDASNLPGQDNGAFNPSTIDPSAAFLHASPNPQDPNQFQRMFNGVPRNASPGFHNPNQVIPSKRPRPEDGMPMSPRPAPGGVTGSRSQTPQVPYPGYQGPANGTPQFPQHPTPYQHLQQGASPNVTQSPVMQDFDQQSVRMGTASPSPFSPAGPHVGPHMSPSQSDHGSRVNTPQNNNFMPGQAFPQGMGGQFQGPGSAAPQQAFGGMQQGGMQQVPPGYHQALAAQQQRLHAMSMQNRQMNANPQMAGRPVAGGMNPMANPQQIAAFRQMQQNVAKPSNPEAFMRAVQKFQMSRNLPFDPNPIISGRPLSIVQLYGTIMKMGGSKKVTAMNGWPAVAQHLQFPQMQFPLAAQELREYYQRNLAPYEQAFISSQQKQFAEMQQQQNQQQHQQQPNQQQQHPQQLQPQLQPGVPRQPSDASGMQFQSPAVKQGQSFEQPSQSPQNNTPIPNQAQAPSMNGFATPTQARSQSKPPQTAHRLSVSRQSQSSVPPADNTGQFAAPSPSQPSKAASVTPGPQPAKADPKQEQVTKVPIEDPFKPKVITEHRLHGPIAVDEMFQIGDEILRLKPSVPAFAELGVVDIHALNMGLKCGIQAEIRVALDTLTTLSSEPNTAISLENCDDLVESLVDCAQDQAEFLAEHIPELPEGMRSYEEVTRGCQSEFTSLAEVPEFGSLEYRLDRAVERLICITTIIRNLSFNEANVGILGIPAVTQVFADVFRCLGTHKMFLRTNHNTLDFMKDAVIFMSNSAHVMQIPGKEEAQSLLEFLLAFAPESTQSKELMFTAFNPSIHRYTPAAVDGLAKLLARDDPNRIYFGAIFSGDGSVPARPDLLTRAFGLAVCAVPDKKPLAVADARKIFLMQGLLAADVLTTFADGSLARSWVGSVDGFAIHLLRLSCLLCTERLPQLASIRQRGPHEADAYAFAAIINRGLAILRRLAEKSKQVDNTLPLKLPSGVIPRKESLLGALLLPNMDPNIIRQLLTYARLAE